MPIFYGEEQKELKSAVIRLNNWLCKNVDDPVKELLGIQPKQLSDIFNNLSLLIKNLSRVPSKNIEDRLLPLLKKAIIDKRQNQAFDVEKRSGYSFNPDLRERLKKSLQPFSSVMDYDWFKKTQINGFPKITDFLSIQQAEKCLKQHRKLCFKERIYDEKFHILNAPSLFLPDLNYYRAICELRGVPLCIAYLDIDKFKDFNEKYGEPKVDRDVLPRFMSALEAHVFCHGHAYRYGGDEYVIILPNMSLSHAINFLKLFQEALQKLQYFEIDEHPEVSIGIFEVSEDSIHTDQEVEEGSAFAKNFAKKNGRNCIATFKGQSYTEEDLYVVEK